MPAPIRSFREFWPYYVGEHRRPATRAWHFVGTSAVIGLLAAAVVWRLWWLLAAVPLAGYGFAWVSHFAVEGNRPATFRHPLWSLAADFKMWFLIASGQMGRELRRILGEQP
jgi:hypothetical protein